VDISAQGHLGPLDKNKQANNKKKKTTTTATNKQTNKKSYRNTQLEKIRN
jgi:hypothetical protein